MGAADQKWGDAQGGIQIGLQTDVGSVSAGQPVALIARVRNTASQRLVVEPRFGLVIRRGTAIQEESGGPRSGAPLVVEPGKVLDLAGWRLTERISQAGEYACWVSYRPQGGAEIRSNVVTIHVGP